MKRTMRSIIGTAALLITLAAYSQIDITGLQKVPPDQVPQFGTFWYANASGGLGAPPLPFPPDDTTLPIYVLDAAGQQYVIDDSSVDYGTAPLIRRSQAGVQNTLVQPPGDPYATNLALVAEWLHEPIKLPDGTPTDFQTAIDQSIADLAAAASTNDWSKAALDRALAWAATNDLPAEIPAAGDMDSKAYLVSIDEGPLYVVSCNVEAAQTIGTDKVWPGGSTGLNLNGTNTILFMWDEGQPRLTHREYTNRVFALPLNTGLKQHSTAVAGTLVAGGISNAAKGMSFAGKLNAGNFTNDLSQMPGQINTNNMRLSNHSYEHAAGWVYMSDGWYWYGYSQVSTNEDPKFGNYSTNAAWLDYYASVLTYLGVWAAGNDVSNVPPVQPTNHFEFNLQGTKYATNAVHPLNGDAGGYDTISDDQCAKDILTVGAVFPITNGYSAPSNVIWAPFSGCGPTDDGRIKPDVVAAGVSIITCNYSNNASYGTFSGTSFSSPSAAGSVNLLAQYYQELHPYSYVPLSSTLKGLVIHTADRATTNAGPSYRFGWGLMNTAKAAALMANDATNGLKNFIKQVELFNGTYSEFPVVSTGTNPLVVTICWVDPYNPSPHALTNLDNPQPMLVNDLDLRVIGPNGTTNFPWVLNPDLTNQSASARSAPATTGDDSRNNVEQVYIANPTQGTYLVRITHKGNLQNNSYQWVSILLSGIVPQPPPPLVINQVVRVATNQLAIGWPAVVGQLYAAQYINALSTSNNWQYLSGQVSARTTNVVALVPLDPGGAPAFYRLLQVP